MNRAERAAMSWVFGNDTGSSSMTLCQFLLLGTVGGYVAVPSDAGDFGRCHRLLARVPGWRERIRDLEMAPGWKKLALAWDELEALYLESREAEPDDANVLDQRLRERLRALTYVPPRKRAG